MSQHRDANDRAADAGKPDVSAPSCPLVLPASGRVPGLLALALLPAAVVFKPVFFSLAGGLLAILSLLLAPAGGRCLGTLGLLGAITAALLMLLMPH